MKGLVILALLTLASSSFAFDSATWLGKRAVLAQEAERLKVAYTNFAARAVHPSEAVTITLEQFEDGTAKTVLFAGQAVFFREEHFVWTKALVIRKYDQDRKVVAHIDAETCVVDQTTKSGWCAGHATVTREGSRFEGDGVYFSSPESYVSVFSNSDLRSSDSKMEAFQ